MYNEFLSFVANKDNHEMVKECYEGWNGNKKTFTDEDIKHYLFIKFVSNNRKRDYDIDNCILLDFPLPFIVNILEKFVLDPYAYALDAETWDTNEEIARLIYHLWPKYMNQSWKNYNRTFPHGRIFICLYSIKENLLEFKKLDTDAKRVERTLQKRQFRRPYYYWHILGFIPLLGNDGIPILMNVIKQRYDDAQDMLMFALAQYDPKSFLPHLAYILDYWNTHGNIQFESGTGMIYELKMLIRKYHKQGVNVYDNPTIKEILENNMLFEKNIII